MTFILCQNVYSVHFHVNIISKSQSWKGCEQAEQVKEVEIFQEIGTLKYLQILQETELTKQTRPRLFQSIFTLIFKNIIQCYHLIRRTTIWLWR